MILKHSNNVEKHFIQRDGFAGASVRYLLVKDDGCPNYAIRLMEFDLNGHTSYHAHEEEHEFYFLEGQGILVDNDGIEHEVKPGDVVYIPQKHKHQIKNTGNVVLKVICTIPIFENGDGKVTKMVEK